MYIPFKVCLRSQKSMNKKCAFDMKNSKTNQNFISQRSVNLHVTLSCHATKTTNILLYPPCLTFEKKKN